MDPNLLAFVRTAEALSFVRAGERLGLSPSAVGKSVTRLERRFGVRLLNRSTRRLSLTAEGAAFFERCRRILDDLADAEAMVAEAATVPRGLLRISLPTIGYRFLVPHLAAFGRLYPEIALELDFSDRLVDVVGAGFDAVIRSGQLTDSQLMSRTLGPFRFVLVASPCYLRTHGTPATVADLEGHQCLGFRFPTSGRMQEWALHGRPADALQRRPPGIVCNNMEALRSAALAGLGIAYMPNFLADDVLADGRLVTLLADAHGEAATFSLLWPAGRQLSPKLRAFIDFSCTRLFAPATPQDTARSAVCDYEDT